MTFLLMLLMISSITCKGFEDQFNTTSEYKLAQMMDTMFGVKENTDTRTLHNDTKIVPEQEIKFLCGHKDSPELQDTTLNDPRLKIKINVHKPIFFVLHGWTDSIRKRWVQQTAQNVIQFMDQNACIVDWEGLALYGYYTTSYQNVPIVAEYISKFVEYLVENGIPLSKFSLAGHSVGAHVAGQVGHNLKGQVGEIYGLDPAGPLFLVPVDRGLAFRLDKSDAKYVQMILTSRELAGGFKGDGHENFNPNGGFAPQPNCLNPINKDADFSDQVVCSHFISAVLFKNSIDPSIEFEARQCGNWTDYVSKKCDSNRPNKLGPYSSRIGGDFYLRTSAFTPYNV